MEKRVMCIFLALSSVFSIDGIILATQKIISGWSAASSGTCAMISQSSGSRENVLRM